MDDLDRAYPEDMSGDDEDEDDVLAILDSDSDDDSEIIETTRPTLERVNSKFSSSKRRLRPFRQTQKAARGSIVALTENIYGSVKKSNSIVRKRFQSNTGGIVTRVRNRFFSVPHETPNNYESTAEESAEESETLQDEMVGLWKKNIYDTITLPDLPRLIDRVSLLNAKGETLLDPEDHDFSSRHQTAVYIANVTKTILMELEEQDEAERMVNDIDELLDSLDENVDSDLVSFCGSIVEIVGEDSRVAKIYQCFNQAVIAKCFYILRKMVLGKHMTKDVREKRGWQIRVTLANYIQVRHCRWEQSFEKGDNHWEFEWQISLTFNREMRELSSSRLLINELQLSETMDPELAEEISDMMSDGDLIVQ